MRRARAAPAAAADLPEGYHRLDAASRATRCSARARVIVVPARCYLPPALAAGGRVWGAAVQLYGAALARATGASAISPTCARCAEAWGERGAGVVGINPLHALSLHDPGAREPLQPVEPAVPQRALHRRRGDRGLRRASPRRDRALARALARASCARAARAPSCVDYAGVAARQARDARARCTRTSARTTSAPRRRARARFAHFREARGAGAAPPRAARGAGTSTTAGALARRGREAYRDPDGAAVRALRRRASPSASASTSTCSGRPPCSSPRAQAALPRAGHGDRPLPRPRDLDRPRRRGGVGQPGRSTRSARSVGAPPDEFNPQGQDWGLPPLAPERLREARATRRSSPRCAPTCARRRAAHRPRDGPVAPVLDAGRACRRPRAPTCAIPFDDLLGILALESHRNRCLVIGEDLGTVPDEVRARARASASVLSYRLLLFERDGDGDFKPPAAVPAPRAGRVVARTTCRRFAGCWEGDDLRTRARSWASSPPRQLRAQVARTARRTARALVAALARERLLAGCAALPPARRRRRARASRCTPTSRARPAAADGRAARGRARRGASRPTCPAPSTQHPNWRRKLPLPLEELEPRRALPRDSTRLLARCARRRSARGARRPPASASARIPRATYRAAAPRRVHLRATRPRSCPTSRARRQPRLLLALPARAARQHARLRHRRPQRAQPRDRHARRTSTRFVAALRAHGMGQMLDIVPNHMGVLGADNAWWLDVLENGPASALRRLLRHRLAPADRAHLANQVLLPVLGDHYGVVLERGELKLALRGRRAASFACATTTTASRSTRASTRASSRAPCARSSRGDAPQHAGAGARER